MKSRLFSAVCACVCLLSMSTNADAASVDTVATFQLSGTVDVYTGDQFVFGPVVISTSSVSGLISSLEGLSSCDLFNCPLGGPAVHQLTWESNFPFAVILTTVQSDLTETTESLLPYSSLAPAAHFVTPETNDIIIVDGNTFTGNLSISVGPQGSGGIYPFDNLPTFQACVDSSCAAPLVPVPVPATVYLFGSGLLGLMGISWRKKAA